MFEHHLFERVLTRANGQEFCRTSYCQTNNWLQATWKGFVSTQEGQYGADEIRRLLQLTKSPYFLNDNSEVRSPWFDSIDWLEHLWLPNIEANSLCYVAHIMQPHVGDGLGLLLGHDLFAGKFDFQLFTTRAEAASWLRECQLNDSQPCVYVRR